MGRKVPTLSTVGYVDSVPEKAQEAMLGFFYSRPHQSFLYKNLRPLPYLVAKFGNNEVSFRKETVDSLKLHLQDYFDYVEVSGVTDVGADGSINLTITVIISEDGTDYSLGYVIKTQAELLMAILDLNNDGKPLKLRSTS
ncbi:hypothetical protein ACLPJK_26205 [Pseudomonas aeruginosa]|uniref:hypothetical protein n=1 Tax=Pseudomonas aeruginosa TaxID=287 RepID=UPI003D298317